jgi:hypothetical protein
MTIAGMFYVGAIFGATAFMTLNMLFPGKRS